MPEGPEIRRAADKLEAAVGGEPLTEAWFAFEELKPFEAMLVGKPSIVSKPEEKQC